MTLVVATGQAKRLLDLKEMENLLVDTLVLASPISTLKGCIRRLLKQEKQ